MDLGGRSEGVFIRLLNTLKSRECMWIATLGSSSGSQEQYKLAMYSYNPGTD